MGTIPSISGEQLREQLNNVDDNRAPQMVAAIVSFISISTVTVALRIMSRRIQGLKLGADDYMIIISLLLAFGMFICLIYGISYGVGKHIIVAGFTEGPLAARTLYVFEVLFPASNTASKLSTLFLYKRIFGGTHSRLFFTSIYITATLWTILLIVGTACTMFQCGINFSWAWTTDHKTGCLNLSRMIYSLTVISVILNFFVILIPLPLISSLKLSPLTKIGVFAVFTLGCGDIGISIARAIETAHEDLTNLDFTWRQVTQLMLAFSESCLGIICSCFMLMRPVFLRFRSMLSTTFFRPKRNSGPRFALSTSPSRDPTSPAAQRHLSIRILSKTREKLSNVTQSLRSGLSGATVVFSMRRDAIEDLDEWELRSGKDRARSEVEEVGVFTHPWKMDTFEIIERSQKNSISSATTHLTHTNRKPENLALDKPLPPIPDDVSSMSGDEDPGPSFRNFG